MTFQSYAYGLFLVCVIAVYWLLGRRAQNVWLLAASYFFYGYVVPWWAGLLAATTLVDYSNARLIERHPERKRLFLCISLIFNFGVLATMKYCNFFIENFLAAAHAIGWQLDTPLWQVLLPAGLSFYTFQSASYVVDVYRGQLSARRNLIDYALYLSFFPHMIAGPIQRASHLLVQMEKRRHFDPILARDGLLLIVWGLLKKRVLADTAATYADKTFSISHPSFPIIWGGVLCFGVQIYADFSAYTDIARGSARLLGFELTKNFNHPYTAGTPVEFWHRWHISLSTWFRDYVYIPLGGSRGGTARARRNILATFLLSGLWHGASWNYVLWGAWHGGWLVVWRLCARENTESSRIRNFLSWVLTFTIVHFGWLIFRERNLGALLEKLSESPWSAPRSDWQTGLFFAAMAVLLSLPLALHAAYDASRWPARWPTLARRWPAVGLQTGLAMLIVFLILLLSSEVGGDFIYFQF